MLCLVFKNFEKKYKKKKMCKRKIKNIFKINKLFLWI